MENESWKLANQQKNHETFHLIFKILTFMSFVVYLSYTDGQDIKRIDAHWSNESSKKAIRLLFLYSSLEIDFLFLYLL